VNIITNPSLELAMPPPTFSDAGATLSAEQVHSGLWAARLELVLVGDPGEPQIRVGGSVTWPLALTVGRSYPISAWVNGDLRNSTSLNVGVDPGSGVMGIVWTIGAPPAGWSNWYAGSFVAVGTVGQVKWQVGVSGSVGGRWYVDDALVDLPLTEAIMIEQIQAGLLAKARAISSLGGYKTDPKVVSQTLPRSDRLEDLPAIHIRFARLESDDSGNIRKMRRAAFFNVWGFVKDEDATPDATLDLLQDIGTAFETDQTLGGLAFIAEDRGRAVQVLAVDPYVLSPEVERGIVGWVATIRVIYQAPQGTI